MKQISVDRAARIVGVSSATIRNWAKAGYINSACSRPLSFLEESIWILKSQIGSDSFGKLQTRANKTGSVNNSLPTEYAENGGLITHIENVIALFKRDRLEVEPLMFLATLRLLEITGELSRYGTTNIFELSAHDSWARTSVKDVITEWRSSLKKIGNPQKYINIYNYFEPVAADRKLTHLEVLC